MKYTDIRYKLRKFKKHTPKRVRKVFAKMLWDSPWTVLYKNLHILLPRENAVSWSTVLDRARAGVKVISDSK